MLTKEELPACPVATTVRLIGNKWKLLLMRNLLAGPKRFGELRKTIPLGAVVTRGVARSNFRCRMRSPGQPYSKPGMPGMIAVGPQMLR